MSLGSINADFQVPVDRRPEVSETLLVQAFTRLSVSNAAKVAAMARKLGAPAPLFARTVDDGQAEQALRPLQELGVALDPVRRVPGRPTGVPMFTVPPLPEKEGIAMAANAHQD